MDESCMLQNQEVEAVAVFIIIASHTIRATLLLGISKQVFQRFNTTI